MIEGAQDGSFSPDGTKLAYSVYGAGITIPDLATGQPRRCPAPRNGDFNPIWSPDGKQIVFNRGMGIFDLFMVNLDGSDMRQLTHGGVQEWPVGWLPDGQLPLYRARPGERVRHLPAGRAERRQRRVRSQDNLKSISPDGKYILTSEKTFGDRWLVYISELDGSNRWLLNDSSLWVLTPIWSPDGQWLLALVYRNKGSGSRHRRADQPAHLPGDPPAAKSTAASSAGRSRRNNLANLTALQGFRMQP